MAGEFGAVSTGNEVIDMLQDLQREVCGMPHLEARREYLIESVRRTPAATLLKRWFNVSSGLVLADDPALPPDRGVMFGSGMLFRGKLDCFRHVREPELPLDALVLVFTEPEVISTRSFSTSPESSGDVTVSLYDRPAFRGLTLNVPVLAIESYRESPDS